VESVQLNKHISVLILPLLLATACGTKYATPRPPVAQPVDNFPAPEPVTEPQVVQQPAIEPDVDIATTATVERQPTVQSLPAAIALRDQAAIATLARDHSRAIGLLERALRISPDDPQTFYDLATNHLALQQPQQAQQLARRGLTLNPTNSQRDALQNLISRSQAAL